MISGGWHFFPYQNSRIKTTFHEQRAPPFLLANIRWYNRWIHQRCCQSKKIWHNFWWQHPCYSTILNGFLSIVELTLTWKRKKMSKLEKNCLAPFVWDLRVHVFHSVTKYIWCSCSTHETLTFLYLQGSRGDSIWERIFNLGEKMILGLHLFSSWYHQIGTPNEIW